MNLEWEVAHDLITPGGTVLFNQTDPTTRRRYQILGATYKMVPSLRVTADNRSQADGAILHPRYKTGVLATIQVRYQVQSTAEDAEYLPACGKDLREMDEALTRALNSIRRLTQNQQRLVWTPTGYAGGRRMLDFVQCNSWRDPAYDAPETDATFVLETPLPYAIDLTQQVVPIIVSATIVNPGTSDYDPVVKVNAPFSAFTLVNADDLDEFGNPKALFYDASLPGAQVVSSGYAEIDFYRGSIFLNGSGADLTAGLDPTLSDFWALKPGSNAIGLAGGPPSCDVLWNPAWS